MLGLLWEDHTDACECLTWRRSGKGHGVEVVIIPYKTWQTEKQESPHEKIMQEVKSNHNFPHFSAMNSIDRIIRI